MRENRLTERIRILNKNPERRAQNDSRRTVESILQHLQRILNTRHGNTPIAGDYGIPDFTGLLHSIPDSLKEFERTLRTTIQKYEPRLKAVRVRFLPFEDDMLSLRFQIIARLAASDDAPAVVFESMLDSDGKVRIYR